MVPLKDLFSLLATGEFSNLSLAKNSSGQIDEAEYGKVLPQINLAIIEIYKRFRLLEQELVVCTNPTNKQYAMRSEHTALAGQTTVTRYIEHPEGLEAPVNLIEILNVYDESQNRLRMNNSLYIPYIKKMSHDTLQITGLTEPRKLTVAYKAHPNLPVLSDEFDIETSVLDISSSLQEPILYYVAARRFQPMGANNSTANADKSSAYYQQYELACQKIALYGLDVEEEDRDEARFYREGWC